MPKSTKSIKISDKKKPWNKKPFTSIYNINSKPLKKTILIVCEGQTEKEYFKSFPVITEYEVECFDTKGESKLKLVESIKKIKSNFNKKFDEIWCVFDMDVKSGEKEFTDFDNSILKAKKLGYKVAYSNDSFELWFYLHFYFTDAQNLRTFYYKELGKIFGINYIDEGKKNDFCKKIYKLLNSLEFSSQVKAIERAKLLFENQEHFTFHKQNPVTKVYELVEELNRNLKS
jgi:hypothetical protein